MDDAAAFEAEVEAGRALKQAGDEAGAIRHFQRLVERYPDAPLAHAELAYAYDYAGYGQVSEDEIPF